MPLCQVEQGAQIAQCCQGCVHASVLCGRKLKELPQVLRQGSGEQDGWHEEVLACQVGGCHTAEIGVAADRVLADEHLQHWVTVKDLGAASTIANTTAASRAWATQVSIHC